ncbi:four helix bundle protein [Patiriisocius sp. Uisw_017]|uniref:four helix bundle protein n=1 Tax=Patiriisocius sp. Uisw_017 TaxID=3230968 RepID=UPI0039E82413
MPRRESIGSKQSNATSFSFNFIKYCRKAARKNNKESLQFLHIFLGSCMELEIQIIITKNLTFATEFEIEELNKSKQVLEKCLMTYPSSVKKWV